MMKKNHTTFRNFILTILVPICIIIVMMCKNVVILIDATANLFMCFSILIVLEKQLRKPN